ncbi:MAG: hypothetical protein FJ319_10405 [SAR202 cluster bacterium]|nr:hypothetical protein [SAR202 cluster bacterium]
METNPVAWQFLASEARPPVVRDIRSDLQLFFDEWLIDGMAGARLKLHPPIEREVVMEYNKPWEGETSGVGVTVFKDGPKYRMWYASGNDHTDDDGKKGKGKKPKLRVRWSGYAESTDAVHWERPELGLIEFEGSKANNLMMNADMGWNLSPFIDGHPEPRYPGNYKALVRLSRDERYDMKALLRGYTSDDGVHWSMIDKDPLIEAPPGYMPRFDSPMSVFWDSRRAMYVAYMRGVVPPGKTRTIRRSVSTDFRNWSVPEEIDLGDSPTEELYMSAATPYFRAPGVYVSFPKRYAAKRTPQPGAQSKGVSETCFMASRDGVSFRRYFMEAIIKPGPDIMNWYKHNTMVATGILETGPAEISLYAVEYHGSPAVRLRRYTARTDGFTSAGTGYGGGEMMTKPFTFEGDTLVINYSTSVVGSMRAELQDREGRAVEGFKLEDCEEIYGDEIERVVKWKGGTLSDFQHQPVRLRFAMSKETDLYSIRFRNAT